MFSKRIRKRIRQLDCNVLCLSLLLIVIPSLALSQSIQQTIKRADELFDKGDFEKASKIYEDINKNDPDNYLAAIKLGSIALFGNKFIEAERFLKKAIELNPKDVKSNSLLAEVFYRQDKFVEAARLFKVAGEEGKAKRLEGFKNEIPYRSETELSQTEITFEITDPLPVLKLKINGTEAEFILDTGGDELHLDTEFAEQVGAEMFGEATRNFAGGMKGTIKYGKVDLVEIGRFKIKSIPVNSVPMGMIAQAFGRPIKGVIGTVFLYHFLFTIDYPAGKMILREKTSENALIIIEEYQKSGGTEMPFWLVGDHVMVAKGRVNNSPEYLFYLDTGMAGAGGVMVSPEFAAEAEIGIPKEEAQGIGGAGTTVSIKPIVAKEVWLGNLVGENIRGLYGGLHSKDEYRSSVGFRIPGIISHDFFRSYRLTFDYMSMKVRLVKG